MAGEITLARMNFGFCTDPNQTPIAGEVQSSTEVDQEVMVDVLSESLWIPSTGTPDVISTSNLVNCTTSIRDGELFVTSDTVGTATGDYTISGGGDYASSSFSVDVMPVTGGIIAAYSGSDELGTLNSPAISPFGTTLIASLADQSRFDLFSELYSATWDFGDPNAGLVTSGPRAGQSMNSMRGPLVNSHTFTVPDGQGLTEFVVTAMITDDMGQTQLAQKSIWVIDQASYYGAANTIYVSNTLTPVDEATFVAAGAEAGATYQDTLPAYNEFAGKRVLIYGGDLFDEAMGIGLGENDCSVGSWGTGNGEITRINLNVNSRDSNSVSAGSSGVKDADIVNGFCRNIRLNDIRVGRTTLGLSIDHLTVHNYDSDYSANNTPDTQRGIFDLGNSYEPAYTPSNGLDVNSMPYSAGVYISNANIQGSSALSIITDSGGSSGSIFDWVGGSAVTSYEIDGNVYPAGTVAPLPSMGDISISATGDYLVNSPTYTDSNVITILVNTDDGVKTFYTGEVRPVLGISGIYSQIQGLSVINTTIDYNEEHHLRIMGAGLVVVRDFFGGGNMDQSLKHNLSTRIASHSAISTTLPPVLPNTNAFGGGTIPFGLEGLDKWGGQFRDSVDIRPTDMSVFSYFFLSTTTKANMTGNAAAAVHFAATQGSQNPTNPDYTGLKDNIVYSWGDDTDRAATVPHLLNTSNNNMYRFYVISVTRTGDTNTVTLFNTNTWSRDDVLEPFYRDIMGDLPEIV